MLDVAARSIHTTRLASMLSPSTLISPNLELVLFCGAETKRLTGALNPAVVISVGVAMRIHRTLRSVRLGARPLHADCVGPGIPETTLISGSEFARVPCVALPTNRVRVLSVSIDMMEYRVAGHLTPQFCRGSIATPGDDMGVPVDSDKMVCIHAHVFLLEMKVSARRVKLHVLGCQ